jgi:glycosyltransferase involved in cell wall biosynthesis
LKIAYLVPGSGGQFYCQNCLRDGMLIRALHASGVDVTAIPVYLRPTADHQSWGQQTPLFFGAVDLYLLQKLPFLKTFPKWVNRLLRSPFITGIAARKSRSVRASGLEEMTLAMLQCDKPSHELELKELCDFVKGCGADLLHISSPLLAGVGKAVQQRLSLPIVCSLQDEDSWVDTMDAWATDEIWQLMRSSAQMFDATIACSHYFKAIMQQRLGIDESKMSVIYPGIDTCAYAAASEKPDSLSVGYLSRMAESLGLETLVETFITIKKEPDMGMLRLRVCGGALGDDQPFLKRIRERLVDAGIENNVDFVESFDHTSRIAFLQSLSVMSVPVPRGEAFGMHQIEAMASGIPVVQPAVGAFQEVVTLTQGGVLYDPMDMGGLTRELLALLRNPADAAKLGRLGREGVATHFSIETTVEHTIEVYKGVLGR